MGGLQETASENPFSFPNDQAPSATPSLDSNAYYGSNFNPSFQNFPNIYSVAGSDPQESITPLNDDEKNPDLQENLMGTGDDGSKKILHSCDPECDPQGCYGKGPTQCVACKHYKLDK